MSATSLHAFFAMGGYAIYVWPAYGVFFIVLLIDWLAPQLRRRRLLRELRARIARQDARKGRAPAPSTFRGDHFSPSLSPNGKPLDEGPRLP